MVNFIMFRTQLVLAQTYEIVSKIYQLNNPSFISDTPKNFQEIKYFTESHRMF